MEIDIAKLLNVSYNTKTGQVFLTMEVLDPVWKQKFLHHWQDLDVKLTVNAKEED